MRVGIVGSRRGLRVILHGKDRKFFVANAFHRSIVEIDVGDLESRCTRDSFYFPRDREPMVLGGDKYMSCRDITDGLVATPVPVGKFDRLTTEGESQ